MSEYLLGLLGHPLSHSPSPILHAAALQYSGLKGEYRLFDIPPESLTTDLKTMLDSGLNGFNVTIPYKQDIYRLISNKTDEAKLSGAVNTVKVEKDGKLSGHNTDIIGFKLAFSEAFNTDLKNKTALVIGAGGAARAVVVALAQMGLAKIKVIGRDPQKVNSFIAEMQTNLSSSKNPVELYIDDQNQTNEISCIVNASSLGLLNESAPIWLNELVNKLPNDCLCFDVVYRKDGSNPLFAQLAAERKLRTTEGLSMLIHQACHAFEYWTEKTVPAAIMRNAL